MITVRALIQSDILGVASLAREADIIELRDGAGVTVKQAISDGLAISCACKIIESPEGPLAALGDSKYSDHVGVPWLVSTKLIEQHRRGFLRVCRPLVQDMLSRHSALTNLIDCRNVAAIRWLQWLGFRMAGPVIAGRAGMPHYIFTMER